MKRVVLGVLGGAAFGGVVAAGIPTVLIGLMLLLVESHPIDRERDLARYPYVVSFCAVCGATVGGLAGFASHFPESGGVPFLRCCVSIAVGAGVVRFFTAPVPKISESDQWYVSYAASFGAAIMVTALLTWMGVRMERSSRAQFGGAPSK